MTATAAPATLASYTPAAAAMSPLPQFRDVFVRENATTRRVLAAIPENQSELRASERSKTAREIAFIFSKGQGGIAAALTNQWQWPPQFPPVPESYAGVIAAFDATTAAVNEALATTPESRLFETLPFFTAPKQTGEIPVIELIWFMLMDSIHHRGQLSVYLRMMGAKVPSIYGPSADEPWI